MQSKSKGMVFSGTDLGNHFRCHHLTWLNKRAADGELRPIHRHDPVLDLLIERGLLHEEAFLSHLKDSG